jgi:hypothetical protein
MSASLPPSLTHSLTHDGDALMAHSLNHSWLTAHRSGIRAASLAAQREADARSAERLRIILAQRTETTEAEAAAEREEADAIAAEAAAADALARAGAHALRLTLPLREALAETRGSTSRFLSEAETERAAVNIAEALSGTAEALARSASVMTLRREAEPLIRLSERLTRAAGEAAEIALMTEAAAARLSEYSLSAEAHAQHLMTLALILRETETRTEALS